MNRLAWTASSIIAEGGFGAVWRARLTTYGFDVAVKLLHRPDDFEFRVRFENEVEALRRLSHPNIVTLLDQGVCDRGPYYVMEYLRGGTLRSRLRAGMSLKDKIGTIEQIANALAHAHAHGIVHRDLKPENILFDADGTPKLGDFGCLHWGGHSLGLTRPGLGTPGYCAPEQQHYGYADARSDLYSLGVVLLELFYGEHPEYRDNRLVKWSAHDDTPQSMRRVIGKLVAWDANDRFQSVQEFHAAFRAAAKDLQEAHSRRARRFKIAAAAAMSCVAVGAGIYALVKAKRRGA